VYHAPRLLDMAASNRGLAASDAQEHAQRNPTGGLADKQTLTRVETETEDRVLSDIDFAFPEDMG